MEGYLPEKTCRTCLQKSDELTSLLSKDDDTGLTLLEKLCFCASMQVVVSEHTPSKACPRCVRSIVEYYTFKRRCELSEKTLEVLCSDPVANTNTKIEVDYEEVEVGDSTVVNNNTNKMECDDFDLFSDDDINNTPCTDEEKEVEEEQLTPGKIDDRKEEAKHPCDMCSSSFKAADTLQRHKQLCHLRKRHRCEQCGASFPASSDLYLHMELHKEDPKYICETCGREYKFEASLQLHIKENHAAEPKVYECNICGKTYNVLGSLHSHKRTHKPPSCICEQCGRPFLNSHRLKQHIRYIHEKPHVCDTCNKRFGHKYDLVKHKAHHVNEMAKPYGCELCEKRFSTTSAVAFHVSTLHKGKKHLKCDVCGMEFYNRFHYAAHYSSHTGVKPYQCDGCRRGFNYNTTLVQHKKKCASLLALTQQ